MNNPEKKWLQAVWVLRVHKPVFYPVDSPGGWQLIGQTPIAMFTPDQLPPCVLMPGDEVVMYPISLETFKHWSAR
ncbi:MAG: carboxyltransferase domain-containing protein [Bacteroidota bacterium]